MKLVGILVTIAIAVFAACSSHRDNSNPGATPAPSIPTNRAAPGSPQNIPVGEPVKASSSPTPGPETPEERLKKNRDRARTTAASNIPLPPLAMRPGPEGTEIGTAMNGEGQVIEVRTFPKNSPLERVEATWTSSTEKSLKFYFRDGVTKEITTDQIDSLAVAKTPVLLQLAGRP